MTSSKSISARLKSPFNWLIALLLFVILTLVIFHREAYRLYKVVTLFDSNNIVYNFQHMAEIFPYREIEKGTANFQFKLKTTDLISSFDYDGETYQVEKLLEETATTGLLVIKEDSIVFEDYRRGNTMDSLNMSWSVNKSFVSALIGIAIEEALIDSVDSPITRYVPMLKGTGYDGISIKHILQMSSGVAFDEDYAAFFSDINKMGRVIALGNSINEFAASLTSDKHAGEYHHYVSMDTQVLGMLLKEVTALSPSVYLEQKIWKKLGMRSNARWLIDDEGMELAFGTLNVTLRDYARFGLLYMNEGKWLDEQLLSREWIEQSIRTDAPHLIPGENSKSSSVLGYGYHWWIPEKPQGDFLAQGVYGQYIYVNPDRRVVIVKTSADPDWRAGDRRNLVMVRMFQEIANSL